MTANTEKPEWAQSKREKENALRVSQGLKPKRRIMPWIVLGALVVGGGVFVLMQPPAPEPVAVVDEAPVLKQILQAEIVEIAPTTLNQTVKVTGSLVPAQQSSISAQASGRVISVNVRPGDSVKKGDVLAEIDRATLEIMLNQQRATAEATRIQLLNSRQQLERTEELARQGLASPSTLEQARTSTAALEANLAALESGVKSAEIGLDNATVRAPFDGVVSDRSVEPDQVINAGTPLFTVVNLDRMEFQANASVNNSAFITADQSVEIEVSGVDGQTFTGKVVRVNPVAAAGTRVVPVYIELDNRDGMLRGGMFAIGYVTVAQKTDAIAINALAVREDAEGHFVLGLEGGKLVRKAVQTGTEWSRGRVVEVNGLAVGDSVVNAALPELDIGDSYEVVGN